MSSRATLKATITAKYNGVLPQSPKLTPLSETTSIPATFIWEPFPPGGGSPLPAPRFSNILLLWSKLDAKIRKQKSLEAFKNKITIILATFISTKRQRPPLSM